MQQPNFHLRTGFSGTVELYGKAQRRQDWTSVGTRVTVHMSPYMWHSVSNIIVKGEYIWSVTTLQNLSLPLSQRSPA